MLRINFFYIKNTKKKLKSKSVRSFCKIIFKNLGFKIIFIILIITLNLHDPVGLAAIPDPIALDAGLAARSCHKSVINK
jgi:hypothetical protein